MDQDFIIELVKIFISIVGGLFLVGYWSYKKDRLERYRFLDDSYNKLLAKYYENPRFGDANLVGNFDSNFKDEEFIKYHYFAMSVNTFLESIHDMFSGNIPTQWVNVYKHHSLLHSKWLFSNGESFMKSYVESINAFAGRP